MQTLIPLAEQVAILLKQRHETISIADSSTGAASISTSHCATLDGPGPVIAGGMLCVTSGYGNWSGLPGNVLLAFTVDGK